MEYSKRLAHLVGQEFGRWKVLAVYKKEPGANSAKALCECQCQSKTQRLIEIHSLNRGRSGSCGCVTKERMTGSKIRQTHGEGGWRNGQKRSPEYQTWLDMGWRCHPESKWAHRYFERGIAVCERWKKYENFLEDMGRKPSPKHEIDRINNDLGYCKENCRWATELQQALNRSNAIFIYLDGEIVSFHEAAKTLGISYQRLYHCTQKIEWDSDEDYEAAITRPLNPPTLVLEERGPKKQQQSTLQVEPAAASSVASIA